MLPSAYWVEISIESDFFPYTLPMSIAGAIIFFFALAASVYVAVHVFEFIRTVVIKPRAPARAYVSTKSSRIASSSQCLE